MVEVMVERSFEDPVELGSIQAMGDRGAWCHQEHNVRFVTTWFSKDRRRMLCLYEAPDAESVRIAQRKAGMPLDRVWSFTRNSKPADWPDPPAAAREHVIVERTFAEPITPEMLAALFEKGKECLPRHQVAYVVGYISSDRHRMICVFAGPDAESVRLANHHANVPFDRAWTATLHGPGRRS